MAGLPPIRERRQDGTVLSSVSCVPFQRLIGLDAVTLLKISAGPARFLFARLFYRRKFAANHDSSALASISRSIPAFHSSWRFCRNLRRSFTSLSARTTRSLWSVTSLPRFLI